MIIVSSKSPQIDLGNFMVYQKLQRSLDSYRTRDVFIYWKEIHEEKYCWYNFFAYFVTCTLSTNDEKIVKNIKILLVLINIIMYLSIDNCITYSNFLI